MIDNIPTIATHQNSFLPYIGYWNKVASVDTFIVDTANDLSNSFIHRTYARTKNSELEYITLPIGRERWYGHPIEDVTIDDKVRCSDLVLGRLAFYHGSPFYRPIMKQMKYIMENFVEDASLDRLYQLNDLLFDWIKDKYLILDTKIVRFTKELKETKGIGNFETKSERMVKQLSLFRDSSIPLAYFSGAGGMNYFQPEPYRAEDITVYVQTPIDDYYRGTILDYMFKYSQEDVRDLVMDSYTWNEVM